MSLCFQKTEFDRELVRKEMEQQLEAWHQLSPGSQEEVGPPPAPLRTRPHHACLPVSPCLSSSPVFQESTASSMWHQYQHLTSALSQQLCEQLRLILEPTQAAKLKSGPPDPPPPPHHHGLTGHKGDVTFCLTEGTTGQGSAST